MDGRALIPLIDMVFLTLGSIVALLTQMRVVQALDVQLVRVGPGVAASVDGEFLTLSLDAEGLRAGDRRIALADLPAVVGDAGQVVLRVDRAASGETAMRVLAELGRLGVEVRPEVDPAPAIGAAQETAEDAPDPARAGGGA